LAVKDKQPKLHQAVQDYFTQANKVAFEGYNVDYAKTLDKKHGRIESRSCWVAYDALPHIDGSQNWEGLQTIVMVESERTVWGIETSLHWKLDIAFLEDESRIRKGNGAENLAILRHIALNLLNKEDTAKIGLKNKRLKVGR